MGRTKIGLSGIGYIEHIAFLLVCSSIMYSFWEATVPQGYVPLLLCFMCTVLSNLFHRRNRMKSARWLLNTEIVICFTLVPIVIFLDRIDFLSRFIFVYATIFLLLNFLHLGMDLKEEDRPRKVTGRTG